MIGNYDLEKENKESIGIKIKRTFKDIKYELDKLCTKVRDYDIIIVGEDHISKYSLEKEYNLINELSPAVIFYEGGDIPHKRCNFTLETLQKKLNDFGLDIKLDKNDILGEIYEKLKKKPIYLLENKVLENVVHYLTEKLDKINEKMDEKKTKLYKIISEILDYIIKTYENPLIKRSLMLADLSYRLNIPVINTDFDEKTEEILSEIRNLKSIENRLYQHIIDEKYFDLTKYDVDKIENTRMKINNLNKEREKYMTSKIEKYLENNRSRGMVMVIVGKSHAKEIKKMLKKHRTKIIDVAEPVSEMESYIRNKIYRDTLLRTE